MSVTGVIMAIESSQLTKNHKSNPKDLNLADNIGLQQYVQRR